MIFLCILGGIFALILLALLIPVSVWADYEGDALKASVHYLFFSFSFSPDKVEKKAERKVKKTVESEYEKQKEEEETRTDKLHAAIDTAKTVWSIIGDARWGLSLIRRNLVFYRVRIIISVARNDAHETAEHYGRLCSIVFPVVEAVSKLFKLREPYIYMAPDFLSGKSVYYVSLRIRLTPIIVLAAAGNFFIKYLRSININKKKRVKVKDIGKSPDVINQI